MPTQSDHQLLSASLYPGAGELVIYRGIRASGSTFGRSPVDVASCRSRDESIRRAARQMRRYAVQNRLDAALVLTTRSDLSRDQMWLEFLNYRRRLMRSCPVTPPYLAVAEGGGRRVRPHIHLMIPQAHLERAVGCWSAGVVPDAQLLTRSDDIRQFSAYLSKEFAILPGGSQRYRAATGYQVEKVPLLGAGSPALMLGDFEQSAGIRAQVAFQSDRTLVANWEVTDV